MSFDWETFQGLLDKYTKNASVIIAASNIAAAMEKPDTTDEDQVVEIYAKRVEKIYYKLKPVLPGDDFKPKSR